MPEIRCKFYNDCASRLFPDDPEVGKARKGEFGMYCYDLSLCDTCRDYTLGENETMIVHQDIEWAPRQWDKVQQLNAQVLYLETKLNEHIDSKRGDKDPF